MLFALSVSESYGQPTDRIKGQNFSYTNSQFFIDEPSWNYRITTVGDENSSGIIFLVAAQSIILGYSFISRYNWGAYFTGGSFAGASAVMVGMLTFSDLDMNPKYTIPYTIGLSALAYYNLRFANSHSMTRKFWTNAIGLNTTLLGSFLIGGIITRDKASDSAFRIEPGLSTIKVTYRF